MRQTSQAVAYLLTFGTTNATNAAVDYKKATGTTFPNATPIDVGKAPSTRLNGLYLDTKQFSNVAI